MNGERHNMDSVQLRRVATAINDGTHGSYDRLAEGIPLLSAKNIVDGRVVITEDDSLISREDFEAINRSGSFRQGDVLLTIVGSIGRTALFDHTEPVAFQRSVASIRPGLGLDRRFLQYAIESRFFQDQLRVRTRQSAQGGIYLGDLAEVRVPLTDLSTQRTIADLLDAKTARIDALIRRKKRIATLLHERRMTVITDGVSGAFTNDRLVTSTLAWLPSRGANWEEAKLTLLARLGSGHTPSRDHPEWWQNCTIPWITTGEVAELRSDRVEFLYETREKVSDLGIANSAAEVHPAGTVVLCRTASAGYSAIMGTNMATSQDFATWTCGASLRPRFLLLCLRAMRQDLLGRLAMGSTHQTIYMPDIEGLRIPAPPVEEQDAIVTAVWESLQTVDLATDALNRQIALLQEHRQALITAAVTGERQGSGMAT